MSLKPLEVKTAHIATYAVTESRIAKNAVTGDKIVDGAVTEAKLKANAVTTAKIKDKQVTGAKIADATITSDKLVLPIVVPSPIARPISPPVETAEIKDGAVTRAKIAVAAVETDNIKDLNVTGGKLASSAVISTKIADGAIGNSKLSSGSVTPDKLSAIAPPTNGQLPSYNQAQGKFEWKASTGGGSVITFITPICVVDDTNTVDRFLNVDVSIYIPDGAKGVLALLKAVNTSGTPMAQGQNASILNADSQICLTVHLTPGAGINWVDGCAGMVPLAVLSPTRELKYTIERNGVQSRVQIDITGYIT